jgi:hypothetical protein
MIKRDYWAHIAPDGKTPWAFINESGYKYRSAGENLAYGFDSSEQTVAGWMNSPSHRENMLKLDYKEVGFGIAYSNNYQGKGPETVVVAEYGDPLSPSEIPITNSAGNSVDLSSTGTESPNLQSEPQTISRVAVLANSKSQWLTVFVSSIAGAAAMFIILRFGFMLKDLLMKANSLLSNTLFYRYFVNFNNNNWRIVDRDLLDS